MKIIEENNININFNKILFLYIVSLFVALHQRQDQSFQEVDYLDLSPIKILNKDLYFNHKILPI